MKAESAVNERERGGNSNEIAKGQSVGERVHSMMDGRDMKI